MTVAEVTALYLAHTQNEQSLRTFEGRERTIKAFADHCGAVDLSNAKPWHLRLWIDAQRQWRSDWTRKGAISTIQRCFNWALKLGIIDRNPFYGVSQREGEPGRAMTDGEFRAALRASSVPFRRVLMFLRYTGCRPGELASIKPENIDESRGVCLLHHHKTMRKTRKPRVIVLHPVAKRLCAYLIRTQFPDQPKLFVNTRGTGWTRYALACRMKRLRASLALPADCRLYSLRHAFACRAIRNRVEIKSLALLMGHVGTKSTERYIHLEGDYDHLGDAVRRAIG
jgi:integrase